MYQLKKSLGQHFLHDEQMCRKIADQLQLKKGLQLLEIGPGGGALSKYLLPLNDVDYKAIEIDPEKVTYLNQTFPTIQDKLIQADFLKAKCPFEGNFSIIGNFPYNISTQIMFKILDWEAGVDEVVGMFQKEVAQRIAAIHGNKTYGILSVLVQCYFRVEYLFEVHENCFTPPPKVKSAVVRFTNLHNPYQIENKRRFFTVVKTAFGQRRKTLRNALKSLYNGTMTTDEVWNKRAEQLSVSDFVNLYKKYFEHGQ